MSLLFAASLGCDASAPDREVARPWTLEEVQRFGSIDDPGSALTSVADVALLDTAVLVLENDPARVAVFRPDGTWLRDFGREGDGPGELRRPTALGIYDGGVWAGDVSGHRLELFDLRAEPVRSIRWSLAPDSLGMEAVPVGLLADGTVLAGPGGFSVSAAAQGRVRYRSYHRTTPEGEPLATLHVDTLARDDSFSASLGGGGIILGAHPLRQSPLVEPFRDGSGLVAVHRSVAESQTDAAYGIRVLAPDGTVRADATVPYTPIPTDGWLEAQVAEMEADMLEQSGTVNRDFVDAIRTGLPPRAFYPPVSDLVAGADGSVWVRREETLADSLTWQAFDVRLEPVGSVTLHRDAELVRATLDELWVVERDELDVPFLLRMRVVR